MMTAMKVCMCVGYSSWGGSEWVCVCDGVYMCHYLLPPSPFSLLLPLPDIAVGAPGNRTVYIYYGRDDLEQFRTQTPFVVQCPVSFV